MANNQQLLLGEGAGGGIPNYIEEVFNTFVWTGTGSNQTLTTGVDTATHGGLFWTKNRTNVFDHALWSTNFSLAGNYLLKSNTTGALTYGTYGTGDYVSNSTTGVTVYGNSQNYVTWTFRKQKKFFDVVTYTGNGAANRQISHSLGSVPGCIIVKSTDNANGASQQWQVWHRSISTQITLLNTTDAAFGSPNANFGTQASTYFETGSGTNNNVNGTSYVAYLFAHDAGGFGLAGTDNVISCGSFSSTALNNLGWEPQFVMMKRTDSTSGWFMFDNMRGLTAKTGFTNSSQYLYANTSDAETDITGAIGLDPLGFSSGQSGTYIYIAIRRGPMKVPTVGTSVFSPVYRQGTSTVVQVPTGFVTDLGITQSTQAGFSTGGAVFYDRLRGRTLFLSPSGSSAEDTYTTLVQGFDTQSGVIMAADTSRAWTNFLGSPPNDNYEFYANWFFKRAPGFFDMVCYTGNGASGRTIAHNLGVTPEMMILKSRSDSGTNYQWFVYHKDIPPTPYATNLVLNGTSAAYAWSEIIKTPTATTFGINDSFGNLSAGTYVAYLFATCAGVSKVGSYTGTGTTLQIDCGFTAGARWVMIKRTDSTGNWYVWDSARGIIAGNDPYLLLNSTAAEVTNTDYIDTYNAGFEISSTAPAAINASGGTFIFFSIS